MPLHSGHTYLTLFLVEHLVSRTSKAPPFFGNNTRSLSIPGTKILKLYQAQLIPSSPFPKQNQCNKLLATMTDNNKHVHALHGAMNTNNKEGDMTQRDTMQDTPTIAIASNPTFIQNQISIQRSPSATQLQASALSRSLSVKSNGSKSDATLTPPGISAQQSNKERGRLRGDSDSSSSEALTTCSLKKTDSSATNRSLRSVRSNKSVRSVHGIGVMPFGTLRVHSPSPTRPPKPEIQNYLKNGDVIIIRDIPVGCIVGCDMVSFTIKEKERFEGFKDLPSGTHFIWGGSDEASARVGFWLMLSRKSSEEFGDVFVKRWDSYIETLTEEVSAAEFRIQKNGIPEIHDKLLSHAHLNQAENMSSISIKPELWLRLTSMMKGALLTKITGSAWNNWQVASSHDYKRPKPSGKPDNTMDYSKDEVLCFVFPRDTRTFSLASTGRERTEQAMDSSSHVTAIISDRCSFEDSDEIIGELQFCYVTGMMLGNVACMEQWGIIVKVVFRAFKLILDLPRFMERFIRAVHAQFAYDEAGLSGSILDNDPNIADDLKRILITFKARLNEKLLGQGSYLTDEQITVGKAFEEMELYLWKWNWDLRSNYVRTGKVQLEDGEMVDAELSDFEDEDERGEFAPAIVDLDETGRERDRVAL